MYEGQERRRAPRVVLSTTAKATIGNEVIDCKLVNLSALGMLAITSRKLQVGARVHLDVVLPGDEERVSVEALVVRVSEVDGAYASGLLLKEAAGETERVLHDFVKRTRQKTRKVETVGP